GTYTDNKPIKTHFHLGRIGCEWAYDRRVDTVEVSPPSRLGRRKTRPTCSATAPTRSAQAPKYRKAPSPALHFACQAPCRKKHAPEITRPFGHRHSGRNGGASRLPAWHLN